MAKPPATIENAARAVQTTVNREINNTMMNMVSKNSTLISGTQIVNISDLRCAGDLNIAGVTQKQIFTVNIAMMDNKETYEQLMNAAAMGMKNAVDANTNVKKGALALAADMNVSNTTDAIGNIINEVTRNYTLNDYREDLKRVDQSQVFNLSNIVANNCNIGEISQYIVLEFIAKNITNMVMKYISEKVANSKTINETEADTTYEQKGFFGEILEGIKNIISGIAGGMATVVALFLVIIIAVIYLGYRVISGLLDFGADAVSDATAEPSGEKVQ